MKKKVNTSEENTTFIGQPSLPFLPNQCLPADFTHMQHFDHSIKHAADTVVGSAHSAAVGQKTEPLVHLTR